MTVHMQVLVSAFAIAAVFSFECRNAVGGEPQKVAAALQSNLVSERGGGSWTATPVDLPGKTAKSGHGFIASAMRRLDLSSLTMADFGDVEPPR
ncbi:MAG: hypothetical protein JSR99_13950 [Proteobacteria bacterium]|nr:hypothetical protein [Pseudomonadota bacterium]